MTAAATVRAHPSTLHGEVRVPGDKSISHRALLIGALADGVVPVRDLLDSEDVAATAAALRRFGARVELRAGDHGLDGEIEGPLREPDDVIDCGNSGTTMRLVAGLAAGVGGLAVLTGDRSLRRRPMRRVATPLEAMGATVLARAGGRLPPLVIAGGALRPLDHHSPVASAQVKSCVLLAGLAGGVEVTVRSPARSRDHTERMLGHLAVTVERVEDDLGERVRLVPGPVAAAPLAAPGDLSSAAFWMVAAACGAEPLRVRRVGLNPTRDGVLRVLRRLGATVAVAEAADAGPEPVGDVLIEPGLGGGAEIEGAEVVDALDELPVLALAGAMSAHGLTVRDAAELRVKESDRIDALARLFTGVGMTLHTAPDGFDAPGGQRPRGGVVDAEGDHRIAMTGVVAGLVGEAPVEVRGARTIATSYPRFLADVAALGGHVEVLS